MTITGMELPIGDKNELTTKVPRRQTTRKAKQIGSLSLHESGFDVNSHIPLPMATFPDITNYTKNEKPNPYQPSSTPEQSIHPSMPPEQQAAVVKRAFIPAALATILGMKSVIGASGYRVFLDDKIRESGNPSDPVENMLLEQTIICHLCSMQMLVQAHEAQGTEASEMYMSAGSRLSAEFRKTALALKEYRKK